MTDRSGSTSLPREWNATSYHRVANPHVDWGRLVLERMPLRGDERVIDAGCGTGRLTELVLERVPAGHVLAIDGSANMLAQARAYLAPRFGERVTYLQADLSALSVDQPVNVVFSTATFHWIADHPALFAALFRTLVPGGWLVAQCGGGPNIASLVAAARDVLAQPPFVESIGGWGGPWNFADAPTTAQRLRDAGFVDVVTEVIPAPTQMPDADAFREFLTTVVFGSHLQRLPTGTLRRAFIDALVDWSRTQPDPWLLDYWRLNITARRP